MIEVTCGCEKPRKLPESAVGKRFRCPKCGLTIQIACGEALPEGAGDGDFDASLSIATGPAGGSTSPSSTKILLGGVAELTIGSKAGNVITLPGQYVLPSHARLVRVDFGPSRWKIIDETAGGVFINGEAAAEHELVDGDLIQIGDYQFWFQVPLPVANYAPAMADSAGYGAVGIAPTHQQATAFARSESTGTADYSSGDGPACPSCEQRLGRGAKICVTCGINIHSGRPVLISNEGDEDEIHATAESWIKWISLLVWITPLPIPIRSAAFGTTKPYAIWTIAAITILSSLAFFAAQWNAGNSSADERGGNFMLWPPADSVKTDALQSKEDVEEIKEFVHQMSPEERQKLRQVLSDPKGKLSDDELARRMLAKAIVASRAEFNVYQLLTCAFLHDPTSIYGFVMHLGGNLLFLFVFGSRVNALIGNIATAILYPVLAIGASLIYLWSESGGSGTPSLGASGAIMGLAGVYLILFPVHKVVCAMWISLWLRFRRIFGCKIFELRGFWLLLIYFGYDLLMNWISKKLSGGSDGVAHWAHMGGFMIGVTIGLGILFSRQFNTRGGDLLSVTLGKNAWPMIGKPSRWAAMAR